MEKIKQNLYLTFRALWHRNYRLFFTGQCISLIGTWIQQVAMSWLIYSLTKSALLMGIITFISSIPMLIASPFAGVLIDRIDKYKTLIILQSLFLIEAFVLAVLAITNVIQVWHIVVISLFVGLTAAIDMPLRQAFVVDLVDRNEDLGNAISLNSSSFNLARLIGPAIAGVLIAKFNEGICFFINSLSYVAVIGALFAIKINAKQKDKKNNCNVLKELNEGIQYSLKSAPIRVLITYLAITCFIGMSYPILMPIFAKEILKGNAQTLGILMSASGAGALFGALFLASKKSVAGLEKWVYFASLLFGTGLTGLGLSTQVSISILILLLTGFGMVVIIAACNTLIQHFVDDDKRGRVMSLYTMAFIGTAPIGSLFGGAIAHRIGVPHTFLLCGLTIIFSALVFNSKTKYLKTKMEDKKEKPTAVPIS